MFIRNAFLTRHQLSLALSLLVCLAAADGTVAGSRAQAQTVQAPSTQAPVTQAPDAQTQVSPDPAATDAQPPEEPIGNVATVVGIATVTRNNQATPLRVKDDIYQDDIVETSAKSSLGITFNDATTFNLTANSKITIDSFVYEDGGKQNNALIDVAKGTLAFAAAAVARTGDMTIATPTATLGIRGTTGLIEVPEDATATSKNNVAIKLYPDSDGKVGRIEVNDRAGASLGFLTKASSGFAIRPGAGGGAMRYAAVPLVIPPQQILRDQSFVRQVFSTQNLGRRVIAQQRELRRANPGFVNPNRPNRQLQPGQQRQNGLPGQNRPGPRQLPGAPNRQGQQQPDALPRPGTPAQPGTPSRARQQQQPGSPAQPGTVPRAGQTRPGAPAQPDLPPRAGQSQQPGAPAQPGLPPRAVSPYGVPQGQPLPNRHGVPGLQRIPRVPQTVPGVQRPGAPAALPRRTVTTPPKGKPPPKELLR